VTAHQTHALLEKERGTRSAVITLNGFGIVVSVMMVHGVRPVLFKRVVIAALLDANDVAWSHERSLIVGDE
jgi:hypothetical protein